jgi:hypothetical protein
LIVVEDQSASYFLGPVGVSDPSKFIAVESHRNWYKPLPPIAGWRNWYKRVLDDESPKTKNWDNLHISHYLELSLAETPKNESLLIAASHFWSNGANAFLFGHGPMSPTLADVYMITGLKVTGNVCPYKYKGSSKSTSDISKTISLMALCLMLSIELF